MRYIHKKFVLVVVTAFALVASLVGVAGAMLQPGSDPQIDNASFEDDMDGWTEQDPAAISDVASEGDHSLKITGSPGRVSQMVEVSPNSEYRLSVDVRGNGRVAIDSQTHAFDVSSWTRVEHNFTTGGSTEVEIIAWHNDSNSDVRFDDFQIEYVDGDEPDDGEPETEECNSFVNGIVASDDGRSDGNGPNNAVDGNAETRWSSEGNGRWLELNLRNVHTVAQIEVMFYRGDERTARFDIEASTNGTSWTTVLSNPGSDTDEQWNAYDLGEIEAGYIRIVGFGNTNNSWNSILEARVTTCGDQGPVPPNNTTTTTVRPNTTTTTTAPTTTTTVTGGNTIPTSITSGDLWDLEGERPNPLVNPYTLVFDALAAKVTTPNGNGWRHEYKIAEENRVAMSATYERFTADVRVDMSDGGKTIVAQHHASDTGTISKVYVSDTDESGFIDSVADNGVFDVYVRLRNTSGNEEKYALGTIRSGGDFTLDVINNYGDVRVSAFGRSFEVEVEDDSRSYFKFGNYLQSQDPRGGDNCGSKGNSSSFADCYDDFDITVSKITMTNVTYERRD